MQVNVNQHCRQPSPTEAASKSSNNRTKRKSRWKLKFHHQALPPEYLDHYEATLQQNTKPKTSAAVAAATAATPPPLSPSTGSTVCSTATTLKTPTSVAKSNAGPSTTLSRPICTPPLGSLPSTAIAAAATASSLQSTVRYKDLPYMGEMTLDNARPRRGRKPKKADICHLIYKNYGTTVVDEPLNLCLRDLRLQNVAAEVGGGGSGSGGDDMATRRFKFAAGTPPSLQERRSASLNDNATTGGLRLLEKKNRSRSHEMKRGRSRKSLAREKLEKTFKERGFLIQTQQLESAQGATYCKFRQLRKFTRYLFRSWKHHLPGDVVSSNEA